MEMTSQIMYFSLHQRDINLEMVADGWAWTFGFSPEDAYLAAEATARENRRGLWFDARPMSPADWRALHPREGGVRG